MTKKLVEKWKNRETKKSLKEENLRLQGEIKSLTYINRPSIHFIERDVREIRVAKLVDYRDTRDAESIKQEMKYYLADELFPFIEWNFGNYEHVGKREIVGSIYVSVGKGKGTPL